MLTEDPEEPTPRQRYVSSGSRSGIKLLTTDLPLRIQGVSSVSISNLSFLTPPSSYSSNGAQINRPEDSEIAQSIRENLEPWPTAWNELQPSQYLHADAYEKVIVPYRHQVKGFAVSRSMPYQVQVLTFQFQESTAFDWQTLPPFVYTPLHGVGGLVLPDVCASLGVQNFVSVPQQHKPDPDFPTVKFPNPEEAGALDLAIQTADLEGRTLIIANDPDADRFAAAEKVEYACPIDYYSKPWLTSGTVANGTCLQETMSVFF